jgi:plasmid stabilization system protein ParE
MRAYVLTPLAKMDIFEVWSYIAEDSENAANLVEQAIYDACRFLAGSPFRGHLRADLTSRTLRFWTLRRYPNYSIVYRPEAIPIQVVAILHGKRNAQQIIKQR